MPMFHISEPEIEETLQSITLKFVKIKGETKTAFMLDNKAGCTPKQMKELLLYAFETIERMQQAQN